MKKQRSTSLRIRLASIAILGLLIALAATAYLNESQVQSDSDLIAQDAVPGTINAHYMRMAMSRSFGRVIVAASAQTTQSRDASLKIVHEADVAFADTLKQYEATIRINPKRDRALLEDVRSNYAGYYKQRLAYEALILSGDRDGSASFLDRDLVPAYLPAIKSAEELLKYNHGNSITLANSIRGSVHRLYRAVAVVVLLALACAVVLVANLSIRRRELVELMENEEKFSKAFKSNPSGIAITEIETGRYIEVNESFCRIMGFSPQEMIGHTPLELGIWQSANERSKLFRPLFSGGSLRGAEMLARNRDGTQRTLSVNAELIDLGGKRCVVSLIEDITERRQLERKQAELAAIVESTEDAIIGKTLSGVITSWNRGAEKIFGYTATEAVGEPLLMIFPPERKHEEAEILARISHGETVEHFETVRVRQDGQEIFISATISPLKDGNGKVIGASKIARDITDRKQAEAALQASEELLRHFIKHTPAAVAMFDTEMCYLQASDRWITDYHLEGKDVIGRSHYEVFPDIPEHWKEVHRRALRGQTERCDEDMFPRADGGVEWLQWEVRPWHASENVIGGVIFFTQVITERKRTEFKLRESEELFRTSFESATVGVCLVATGGKFNNVNRTLCDMLGYTKDELLQLTFNDVTHEEDQDVGRTFIADALSGGPKTMQTEKRYLHKDGRVVWAFLSTALVEQSREHGGYLISYIQDITERKRATEQLELLKVSIDTHFDGAFWMDTNNRFVYVNDSGCKALGYAREELLGQPVALVAPRASAEALEQVWKSLRENAFFTRETVHRRKDGSEFPVEIVASYVRFEGNEFNCGFARDITERNRLKHKQAELAAIVASSDDAIIGKSLAGIITSWNRGAERIFGYSAAEAIGQPLLMVIPADRQHEELDVLERIARGETVEHFETVRVCKDGRQIYISATISPLKDGLGKVIGASKIARDVTAQKLADEALREKQNQLILAMDIAKLAHWEFDVGKNTISGDGQVFELLGTTPEQEDGLALSPEDYIRRFVHPEDASLVASEVALGTATTDPNFARQFEHRVIRRDGTERVMMVRSRIIMDAMGRTGKILGTNQDITEQKQAELRIRHLNRVYEVLSDINKTIVREKDPQVMLAEACRIVVEKGEFRMAWIGMFDAAAEKVLPVTSAGVVEGYLDLVDIDLRDKERSRGPSGRSFLTGEHATCGDIEHEPFAARLRGEALRRGYRSSASFPLKVGGKVTGIFSLYSGEIGFFDEEELRLLDELALDIGFALEVGEGESKRRRAEQELRWRTAFFEAQVHSAIDGILVVDGQGRKLLQNRRMNELWKIPPPLADDPDDSKQVQFILGRVKEPEAFAEKIAYLNDRPDESSSDVIKLVDETILERYSAPVRGSDGRYYGRVWTFHDITERKMLEQQFLRAQRMDSIGTLASGVAHDLNNILTPIMMSVSMLRMGISDEKRASLFDNIETSAERGAQIVKQVLTFGRGLEGEKHPLQIEMLINEMEAMIRSTFPKDIAVECVKAPNLWLVLGDATQLHQVLLNLCVNARDAMPNGGRLRLSAANLDLDASYASMLSETTPGPHVLLEVSDTGSGIPPEILERIFDPFFTTKGVGKGTGLGLSTVHGIVKSHGGLLKVASEPGNGTTFQVYLPAAPDQEAGADAGSSAPPPTDQGELVLVVDDEPAIMNAARTVLEANGYRVVLATDGADALAVFAQNSNDIAVVLTDVMMPVMNGVSFLRALRSMSQGVRVIGSTGLGEKAHLATMRALGIETVLHKPYNSNMLLRTIYDVLHPKM